MSKLGIFDQTVSLLHKVLDLRERNQQVIASNIANADTPGYAASRLEFESQLKQALNHPGVTPAATHPAHFPISVGSLDEVEGTVVRQLDPSGMGDKNGVNVDQEMVTLAENQILYEAAVQALNKKLGLLKYVASDGR